MIVSILIHNLNRGSILEYCLSSIAKLTFRPLEVVILDAGSTDDSLSIIDRNMKIMHEIGIEAKNINCPPMGVAASRNLAAHYATGDLLCAIDNDGCFIDSESIQRIVKLFQSNPRLGLVSFQILSSNNDDVDPFSWVFRRSINKWSNKKFRTFTFAGTGFCIRTEAFRGAGGFWEHLKYSREEEELALVLIDKGWEIVYSPDIKVRHYFDSRGRINIIERRYVEMKNGILIFWRRFPMLVALAAVCGRICTMSLKMVLRERKIPYILIDAVNQAIREWREFNLKRLPVSINTIWKYFTLHFYR